MWFKHNDIIFMHVGNRATNEQLHDHLNRYALKRRGSGYAFLSGNGFGEGINYVFGNGNGGGVGAGQGFAISDPCLITQLAVNELIGGEDVVV